MEKTDIFQLKKYFPEITDKQINLFSEISELYRFWNKKINVISRKDVENLFIRHILHSLSISKVISFPANNTVLDVGTGGGFPGIPLAIMFPDVHFTLIDSIAKKIRVSREITDAVGLENIDTIQIKSTQFKGSYDFITGRAVTAFPIFYNSVKHLLNRKEKQNGILYLKGGEFETELKNFKSVKIYSLKEFYEDAFFETKKIIYLPSEVLF